MFDFAVSCQKVVMKSKVIRAPQCKGCATCAPQLSPPSRFVQYGGPRALVPSQHPLTEPLDLMLLFATSQEGAVPVFRRKREDCASEIQRIAAM